MAVMVPKDRVKETSTTVGIGAYQLAGALGGFQTFLAAYGSGTTANVPYTAAEENGNWEVGFGTYSGASNTLTRDLILSNSLGTTAAINWATGTRTVFVTHPAADAMFKRENLAGLADADEALDNLGAGATGKTSLAAVDAAAGRAAIQSVGTPGGDTIAGTLTVTGTLTGSNDVSAGKLITNDIGVDGTHVRMDDGAGGGIIATTDGNGRVSILWNVTDDDHDLLKVGAENALRLTMHSDGLSFNMFDGSGAAANDPITWDEVFKVSDQILQWNGSELMPAGTKMLFLQAAAPTGWTQDTSINDRVLRVVSGAGAGTGGSWTVSGLSGSTTVDNHTLSTSQLSSHNHALSFDTDTAASGAGVTVVTDILPTGGGTNTTVFNQGGGAGHNHTASTTVSSDASWRPLYVDVIACTKD